MAYFFGVGTEYGTRMYVGDEKKTLVSPGKDMISLFLFDSTIYIYSVLAGWGS